MPAKPKPAKKAPKPVKSSASKAPAKSAKKAAPKPQAKAPAKKSPSKKPAPKAAKPVAKAKPSAKQVSKSPSKAKTAKPQAKAKTTPPAKPSAKASSKGKAPTKKPAANVKKTPAKKAAPAKPAKQPAKPAAKAAKPAAKVEAKTAAPAKKEKETAKPAAPAAEAKKAAPAPAPVSKAKESKKSSGGVAPPLSKNFNAGPPIKSVSRTVQEEVGATIDVPRVAKMTPFLKKQKQRLIELRSMLLDQMDSVAEGSLRVRPEGSEASAFGMHQADAGSDAYDRDFALSLLSQEQDSLYEINEALKRIDLGTYGICEMSGKQIPEIRLEALPFTRFTVECQAQIERQNMGGRFRRPVRSLFGLDEAADDSGDDSEEEAEPVDKNAE